MELNEYLKITKNVVGKDKAGNDKAVIGSNISIARHKLDSPSLNYLLGGGLPVGTIIELFGLEQTFKSSCGITLAANLQKITGKFVSIIQVGEVGYTTDHGKNLGLDTDQVLVTNANTAEEALTCVREHITNDFCCVILDSIAGLVPSKLTDETKDVGEVHVMGVRARLLSETLPQFSIKCTETGVVLILINQLRNTNLSGYGNPEGSMGGKGLPYWASIRIKSTKMSLKAKDDEGIDNFEVQFQTIKSKYGKALRRIDMKVDLKEVEGEYKTNFNSYIDVIRMAKQFNVIEQKGSWIFLSLENYKNGEQVKIQGENNLELKLLEDEELFIALRDNVNSKV